MRFNLDVYSVILTSSSNILIKGGYDFVHSIWADLIKI